MTDGGGFCELHGPFDPPHTTCPYCTIENARRQVYGPPEVTRPAAPHHSAADQDAAQPVDAPESGHDDDFIRHTVTPEPVESAGMTEVAPRDSDDDLADILEDDDSGDEAEPQPMGWLIVKEPAAQRGTVLTVQPNQVIGRQGDIVWDDPRVSRQHARLTLEPEAADDAEHPSLATFHIWPFGPTNPVYVNGEAIRGATPLHENDEITLGTTRFVFKVLLD